MGLWGGSRPASEPETRAAVRYVKAGFNRVIALHSSGGFLDLDGPGARTLALRMSRQCGLPLRHVSYQA